MFTYSKVEGFPDLYVLEPKKFEDNRGYFQVIFNEKEFKENTGIDFYPMQENESSSMANVVRGLHFQKGEFEQAKLVKCMKGKIIDVVLCLRKDSPSYGKLFSITLSEENSKQLFIPTGYAHGFIALSDTNNVVRYLTDKEYAPKSEDGILFDEEYLCEVFYEYLEKEVPLDFIKEHSKEIIPKLIYSEKDKSFKSWHKE